jgi:hypothetical protein
MANMDYQIPQMDFSGLSNYGNTNGVLPDTAFMDQAYGQNSVMPNMNALVATPPITPPTFLGGLSDAFTKDPLGSLGKGAQLAGSLGQLWLGMKNYGLLKDQLKENKKQFSANFEANRRTTNASLRDRQRARVASGSGYQSVGEYMAQNEVRGA